MQIMPLDFSEILVTGGEGFIGSHIVDRLLDEEFKVRVLDDLSTGDKKESSATQKQKIIPIHRRRHQKL
jgi:nucleoside-diphosphate-sugar epimerase